MLPTTVFAEVERTPFNHFLLHFYAAIFFCVQNVDRLSARTGETAETLASYPFLERYLAELATFPIEDRALTLDWWRQQIAAWEQTATGHYPLCTLDKVGVDFQGRLALLMIGLVEEDSRFGSLYADLQRPLVQRRPTWELIGRLCALQGQSHQLRLLLRLGLIRVTRREVPQAEWELVVPQELWAIIREGPQLGMATWYQHRPWQQLRAISQLHQPRAWLEELQRLPGLVASGKVTAIVMRGGGQSGRAEALGAVAQSLGQGVLEVKGAVLDKEERSELLGALCLVTHSMPILRYALGPGESVALPDLAGYPGPVGIVFGHEGGFDGHRAGGAVVFTTPPLRRDLRRRHWQEVLAEHAGDDLEAISTHFCIPGETIRQVGKLAIARAQLHGRHEVQLGDVQLVCRDVKRQALDTLAVRLDPSGTWDDLATSETARLQLRELELRCRHRETLLEQLKPTFGLTTGVRALLSGPSGTGKTMSARILAAVLGMELYRLDLAAVVNKYIGETEKNLSQVLARAEELDVILLLDEGDSLLAKRSEVRSSNDRHANMETNYLLQRLESYRGIVLVTTNYEESLDSAFQRRMDVVVRFAPPQPAERLRIWQAHLPARHTVSSEQLEEVALRCVLTGGQIRNAALKAALLAIEDGGLVGWPHLLAAIQGEYIKAGTINPLAG